MGSRFTMQIFFIKELEQLLKEGFIMSNGLVVKVLDSQSRGPMLKTTG